MPPVYPYHIAVAREFAQKSKAAVSATKTGVSMAHTKRTDKQLSIAQIEEQQNPLANVAPTFDVEVNDPDDAQIRDV